MERTMKFEIQMKAKNLWQFSMYHSYRGIMGIFAVIFTCASFFYVISQWSVLPGTHRAAMIFAALMFPVLQPLMLYQKAWKQMRQPVMQSPFILEFREDGLNVTQQGQEVLFPWDQIGRIDKKPKMLIIYMDRIHAYLMPQEVYAERSEELAGFLREQMPKERLRGI